MSNNSRIKPENVPHKIPKSKTKHPPLNVLSAPTTLLHDGQIWQIFYHEEKPNENLGETNHSTCEIHIWTKGIPLGCIKETLQHELLHIVLRDCTAILHGSTSSSDDLEESIIRISSPRLYAMYKLNPHIREYIYE